MFSGIIENLGIVQSVTREKNNLSVTIETNMNDITLGESIAVNGVCLTVIDYNQQGFVSFFLSSETLNRSSLNQLCIGKKVNLERAVTPSTRLSGHIVQGHVDGIARFIGKKECGEAYDVCFALPINLKKYIVEKGSIAIDGISLTVNKIEGKNTFDSIDPSNLWQTEIKNQSFTSSIKENEIIIRLMIIPHTWEHTTFNQMKINDVVNIEVDVIAKYVENLCLAQK